MARRLSKAQTERRCEHSHAARNILRRQAFKSKLDPIDAWEARP